MVPDANDIFSQAGYSTYKARWLAGTNDIFYMVRYSLPSLTDIRANRPVSSFPL